MVFATVVKMSMAGREQNEVVGVLAESSKNSGDFLRFKIRSDISLEPGGFPYGGAVVLDLLMLYCTPVSPLPSASIMNDFMLELNRMSMYLAGEGNTPGSYPYYPYYVIKFGQRNGSSLNYVIKILGKDVLLSNYNAIAQLPMLATVSSLV
jgi:hypothetical protein